MYFIESQSANKAPCSLLIRLVYVQADGGASCAKFPGSHSVCYLEAAGTLPAAELHKRQKITMGALPILQYSGKLPPAAVIVAARLGDVELNTKPEKGRSLSAAPTLTFEDGTKITGVASLLRYVARSSTTSRAMYGQDSIDSTLVRLTPTVSLRLSRREPLRVLRCR